MELWYKFCIWIASSIYTVASWAFQLFLVLAKGNLIESSSYTALIRNAYILIGVAMLFILAFTLLKTMVNPDDQKKSSSNAKKIIINLVTSSIILALLPTIFQFAMDFQTSILDYNVIGNFFGFSTPKSDNISDVGDVEYQSKFIVDGVFTAFFNVNLTGCEGDMSLVECQQQIYSSDDVGGVASMSFYEVSQLVKEKGEWNYYSAFAENANNGEITFHWLLCIAGGVLLIYVAISFCFDMAVRLVKLVFYQIIAPLPIFARVVPEGKFSDVFNKWLKVTLTCYLEVFIRIIVFYFVVYLSTQLSNAYFFKQLATENKILYLFAFAFVIMGLIMFMKQAPKLFSEVTGLDSGNMKLGIKDKLASGGAFAAGAAIGAGTTAMVRNAAHATNKFREAKGFSGKAKALGSGIVSTFAGASSGLVRGGKAGFTSKSVADMKKAAGAGAKGATDSRNRREAYRVQHNGENIIKARMEDKFADIKDWAGGGFEAEESKLKSFNEVLSTSDKAKGSTEKIMAKYGTNSKIVKMLDVDPTKGINKYKGVEMSQAVEFDNLFRGANLSTMENTINAMKNQKLEKKKDTAGNIIESDADFDRRVMEYNKRMSAFDAMYQQVRKETTQNLESLAFIELTGDSRNEIDKYFNSIGVSKDDLSAIKADVETAQNQLNAMGRGQDLDTGIQFTRDIHGNIIGHTGAGQSLKQASDKIEQERNDLSAEVARKKAERESRQQNSGK